MKRPRYRDLTEFERALLLKRRGCGVTNLFFRHSPFRPTCVSHDFHYAVGGEESDRKRADLYLLWGLNRKARHHYGYITLAFIFYILVRVFGRFAFNYSKYPGEYHTKEEVVTTFTGITYGS